MSKPESATHFARSVLPAIVAVPGSGVDGLCGELVGPQARRGRSQGVCAVQRGGRGAVAGRGALLRLVLGGPDGHNKDKRPF